MLRLCAQSTSHCGWQAPLAPPASTRSRDPSHEFLHGRADEPVTLWSSPSNDPSLERPRRGIAHCDTGGLVHGNDLSVVGRNGRGAFVSDGVACEDGSTRQPQEVDHRAGPRPPFDQRSVGSGTAREHLPRDIRRARAEGRHCSGDPGQVKLDQGRLPAGRWLISDAAEVLRVISPGRKRREGPSDTADGPAVHTDDFVAVEHL